MAGTRGFAVFQTKRGPGEVPFVVQHRALEPGATAPVTTSLLSLVSEMYIHFCP